MLYSVVPMLHVCPSIVSRNSGFACMAATASSRIFNASGRRLKRSKSKCTSSKLYSFFGGATTSIVTLALAVPPLPSLTVTVNCTGPGWFGAVQLLWRAEAVASDPAPAFHA
jgi:hypothetical protein